MLPILLKVGPLTVYSFGFMLFWAALLASFLVWKQARREGLAEEKVFDTFLLTMFFGLIGGRLAYILGHWATFSPDPARILLVIRYPGLSLEGGLATGMITAATVAALLKLDPLSILDIFMVAFSWALILGLGGCYLDGCVTNFVQAPVALAGGATLAAGLLLWVTHKMRTSPTLAPIAHRPGLVMSTYLIFFSLSFLILGEAVGRSNKIFYLGVLAVAGSFFLWRYGRILNMIKFPANVLSQISGYLEKRRQDIEHRLGELKKEDPFEDKSRLLDRASDDTEAQSKAGHERVAAMQQQLNLALIQTRKALAKIRIGKYGVCENCGKMIDTDRLAAMPAATLCLTCEKRREK